MMKKLIFLAGFLWVFPFAQAAWVPGEALLVPIVAPYCAAKCCVEENPPRDGIRADETLGWATREGLAVSRILTSPLNLLCAPYGMSQANNSSQTRTSFDKFAVGPTLTVVSVCYGAFGTVDEILVGAFEMLTTMKVRQVYYPWETYRVSSEVMRKWLEPGADSGKAERPNASN